MKAEVVIGIACLVIGLVTESFGPLFAGAFIVLLVAVDAISRAIGRRYREAHPLSHTVGRRFR